MTLLVLAMWMLRADEPRAHASAERIDTRAVDAPLAFVRERWEGEMARLRDQVRALAVHDATYEFARRPNFPYVDDHYGPDALARLAVDTVLIVDGKGRPVFWRRPNDPDNEGFPDAELFLAQLPKLPAPRERKERGQPVFEGFVQFRGVPALVSAIAIEPASGGGAPRGFLIYGRAIDGAVSRRVLDGAPAGLDVMPAGDALLPAEVRIRLDRSLKPLIVTDEQRIRGYLPLVDVQGRLLRVYAASAPKPAAASSPSPADAQRNSWPVVIGAILLLLLIGGGGLWWAFVPARVARPAPRSDVERLARALAAETQRGAKPLDDRVPPGMPQVAVAEALVGLGATADEPATPDWLQARRDAPALSVGDARDAAGASQHTAPRNGDALTARNTSSRGDPLDDVDDHEWLIGTPDEVLPGEHESVIADALGGRHARDADAARDTGSMASHPAAAGDDSASVVPIYSAAGSTDAAANVESVQSAELTRPVEPVEPLEPVGAAADVETVQPVVRVEPIASVEPIQPDQPIEPIEAVEADEADESIAIESAETTAPAHETAQSVEPAPSVEPAWSIEPAQPTEPAQPADGPQFVEPAQPVDTAALEHSTSRDDVYAGAHAYAELPVAIAYDAAPAPHAAPITALASTDASPVHESSASQEAESHAADDDTDRRLHDGTGARDGSSSDTAKFEISFDVDAAPSVDADTPQAPSGASVTTATSAPESAADSATDSAPVLAADFAPAFAVAFAPAPAPAFVAAPRLGSDSDSPTAPTTPANAQAAIVRRLLEDGRLRVHYQPQISTANGTIVGVEALVRWEDDEAALRAAGELFGDGTSADSFSGATEFVLRRACADRRDWLRQVGRTLPVSVNVGLAELREPGFIARVLRILEAADLPAAFLEFEVPERALAVPGSPESEALEQAYRSGIGIAIGGFVAADAPLRALTQIPVAKLKLHRSLVADLPDDTHARMVVDAVLAVGRTLNVAVCAEGVERAAQAAYLERRQCPVVQGWHYARPMDADQFFALMKGSGVDTVRLPLMDVEELEAHARAAGVV